MKIVTEYADMALAAVGKAIAKDPLSWDGWLVWHAHVPCQNNQPLPPPTGVMQEKLQAALKHLDGNAFFCSDGDIVVLIRSADEKKQLTILAALESSLKLALQDTPFSAVDFQRYELHYKWRSVASLCRSKEPTPSFPPVRVDLRPNAEAASKPFFVEESLAAILESNINLRRFRNPPCVLIIEDDPVARRLASLALKNDFRLITSETAEDGISQYMLNAPDIVFLDINLPDHDGFTVLNTLLSCDKSAYIVMFSSNGYTENLADALNRGAHGFVSKPFRKETLLHYIRECDALRHQSVA